MARRGCSVAAGLIAMVAASAGAQVRADPGTVINGRVAVRVYVTLSDDETTYVPIGGVNLRFFRTTADTVITVKTDDAGAATSLLLPGEYRLMSTSPVDWKGTRYSWNRLITVSAGQPTIELNAASAVRDATVIAMAPAAIPGSARAAAPREGTGASVIAKDASAATMYSFFLPGSGHLYAGERVKGGALMALSIVGVVVAADQMSCATAATCKSTTAGMTLGAAGTVAFFGSWLYSVFDAGDAVRRFNDRIGVTVGGVHPLVQPASRGRATRLGLSVSLPR